MALSQIEFRQELQMRACLTLASQKSAFERLARAIEAETHISDAQELSLEGIHGLMRDVRRALRCVWIPEEAKWIMIG